MELEGKVAIITGSSRGIGKAMALKFASEGAKVVVNALHLEGAKKVSDEIQRGGGEAIAIKADVSQKAEVQEMVERVLESFGAVHILVNNAGISHSSPIVEVKEEDWDLVQRVNLKGAFLCTQAVLGQMMKQKYGKIINISSLAALGCYNPGAAAYAAAKAGVISLTKSTAREAGPYGINVNCICPGRILTDMVFAAHGEEGGKRFIEEGKKLSIMGRIGSPEDIANLALFLASDKSSFITGQIIRMDGGRGDLL